MLMKKKTYNSVRVGTAEKSEAGSDWMSLRFNRLKMKTPFKPPLKDTTSVIAKK